MAVHSLLHLLYLTDLTHIYTLYKKGDENPIFTNTSLDTFEVNSKNNCISLFALKKELTEDITSKFENKTWKQIIVGIIFNQYMICSLLNNLQLMLKIVFLLT